MKKTIKALKFPAVFLLVLLSFIACDKDFSVVESDVLGEQNVNFKTDTLSFQIAAYNKKLEGLQINGLSANLLGVYNDPAYGQTTASIVTQLFPTAEGPDFGTNPIITSVVLNIPYYSRITGSDSEGNATYTISDSLYGKNTDGSINPIKLSIYQNKYFLRDFDPSTSLGQEQNYYSRADGGLNGSNNFALNGTSLINFDDNKGDLIHEITSFTPSSDPIKTTTGEGDDAVTTQSAPALNISLSTAFWDEAIIKKGGTSVLSSRSEFINYFRGLYFKAESIDEKGSMILLDLLAAGANITINYTKDSTTEGGDPVEGTYVLNFKYTANNITTRGNRLNTFTNNYNTEYKTAIQNVNTSVGDEKLYLKGAEGSMAVVDLFSGMVDYTDANGVTSSVSALEAFKKTYRTQLENGEYKKDDNDNYILKRFINDAQLIIYEDVSILTGGNADLHKYDRIYAYDLENNTQLIDYSYDPSVANTTTPYFSTYFHLGLRNTNDANISKYKIHLTEHLNNILLRDSTNTKIGLVLSSNVNKVSSAKILNSSSTDEVTSVPTVSLLTPRGTILYGTNSSVPANRKMKLKIFFTEPK